VNDRGPYARNRIIDVSIGTAEALGFYDDGLAHVRVEYVGRAPIEGSDDRMLLATLRQGRPAQVTPQLMVASTEPFVPNFNAEEMPLPPDRPFALGSSPAHQAAKSSNVNVAANSASGAGPDRPPARPAAAKNQKLSELSQDSRADTTSAGSGHNDAFVLGPMSARGLY
jgi:rare lipoprotein A